ncbi:hypothetical protein F442_01001 [Phytophthora nicotianae P10297]|uniref:Uncharacterized protein n=3 Tax=Phytophthora nicotianae TaxID=4792 RepID=W3A4U0_PHYNI|nr:hypothetical protein L916_00977 [Phytophthora nicotianae]ETM02622.1 hypothetical protein L917_00945 [Phytophthora nicotianae]ETM55872.1 hypothetical protein L914_00984 [Phytophthora nicotianae]ETO85149.1 hypothetical protein F444_01057 [Phytophthora nicotianae P1976]ETP54191.1 hypothetical protein F442_01001 [Phytophthora nicotianae P10297]
MTPKTKKSRATYPNALVDNARPGGPTTMDVLIRWLTTPGNVKRWRLEPRAPLTREVVELMQEEGLAHRQAPFVRYKLDAIEKQYITAQKWLLETGMHDSFMKGKATKEVRAHVDHICPLFKKLDPAFRGVPFSKKHAETIELDDESAEDVEAEEKQGEESEDDQLTEEEKAPARTEKRDTFRDRLFAQKDNGTAKEKPPISTEERQKKARAFRDRMLADKDTVADKEKSSTSVPQKKVSRLAKQLEPSPGYAAARKSLTTPEKTSVAEEQIPTSATDTVAEKEKTVKPKKKRSASKENLLSSAMQVAMEQAAPEAPKSPPAPGKKRMDRPKAGAVASSNGTKENTSGKKESVSKTSAAKRKSSEEGATTVKRNRTQEQVETTTKALKDIERDALLKRVNDEREALLKRVTDEEKQRHEMYVLERAKLEFEMEAKKVQLVFETAAARKRLDQLGVSQEEIDRILPL